MDRTLDADAPAILDGLSAPNRRFLARFPGEPEARQPIHVVYGGAQIFRADVAGRLGARALESLARFAPDPFTFAGAIGLTGADALPTKKKERRALLAEVKADRARARRREPSAWLALAVYERMQEKLEREPVEDFRIDFEDGFGVRSADDEDREAVRCAEEVAKGLLAGTLPPFLGVRPKALDEESKARCARTLDVFFTTLIARTGTTAPPSLVVTLPKVSCPEQVGALARLLARLEHHLGLSEGSLKIELMIELAQVLFDADGTFLLPKLLAAAEGRCVGAHFGTYDYTASCDVTAAHQSMSHPASQEALALMKIAYARTGIALSDGATNLLPVPIHRGEEPTRKEEAENRRAVHEAWATSYTNIRASLRSGFYQGWDLHPAQLPVRYAATYAFFLEGLPAASARLSPFVERAAQATLAGAVFDDAATGQGLLSFFLRARSAGALTEEELETSGLTAEELRMRSFAKIVAARAGR